MTPELLAELEPIVGQVALRELESAKPIYTDSLITWARLLHTISDPALIAECESTIYDSALAQSFRGNWEHAHFKASACYTEARRRHIASGHTDECRGDTLYSKGYGRVMRSEGHAVRPAVSCTCKP